MPALATLACALATLAALDVGLGFFLGNPYERDPGRAGAVSNYFEYGRSIEGKVRKMLGTGEPAPHPLAQAGWVGPAGEDQPARPGIGQDLLVAVYGMSFAAHIGQNMQQLDRRIAVRFAGGPGATLSHSYAMYLADRGHHEARVVILGVLASSLPGLISVTHMTWNFEGPSPHFYPRFRLVEGRLSEYRSGIDSLERLRAVLASESGTRALLAEIAAHDEFYDPLVFRPWSLDGSVVARLARRAWGQRSKRQTLQRFHGPDGFTNELALTDLARSLVRAFAAQVHADSALPVIVAIHDRGYADHLHRALEPAAADARVVYLSTHEIAPPSDAANFRRDGHFVPAKDRQIAERVLELVNDRLGRR